ncbi:hypothetical protein DT019_16150 [Streptomyces sp. SDr-06]|nr:hypothetical protein DT019_16150 [Streptomyces sp. SDr-06]
MRNAMPHISRERIIGLPRTEIAGIDAGGTKTHMRFLDPDTGEIRHVQARSADYDSLEHLFYGCFDMAGCLPRSLVAGVAGRPGRDGDVRITNHPQWPTFRRRAFAADLGMELVTINDMVATTAGVADLDKTDWVALTPQVPTHPGPALLAVSVGTGVGSASVDRAGQARPAESGHVAWQPVTVLEEDYLRSLQRLRPGIPISVELSIGGLRGIDHMYDFMTTRKKPGPYIQEHVDRFRREHRGIGPVITAAAVGGDACCREIMRLFGAILGQFLRNIVLTCMSEGGSVWLTSGVLQAPGVCDLLISDTAFLERFVAMGAEHAELMREIPLYAVTDRQVAVRGAFALTRRSAEQESAALH